MIHWHRDLPALRRPILLVQLEGFVDAGSAAGTAATFLRHRWRGEVLATFDHDTYIDYRARRPMAVVDGGVLRRVTVEPLELYTAAVDSSRHDAAFLLGPEPDMRWEGFCAEVVSLSRRLGVENVIGLGAYPAAVPHTRPIRIASAGNGVSRDVVDGANTVGGYTGPIGAQTMLQHRLGEAEIPSVGLWAEIPHYLAASPYPEGSLALVAAISRAFAVDVDTTELTAAANLHREQVEEAVAEHPEAREMVAALERHVDEGSEGELPSGEDLAAEIEQFLRRNLG